MSVAKPPQAQLKWKGERGANKSAKPVVSQNQRTNLFLTRSAMPVEHKCPVDQLGSVQITPTPELLNPLPDTHQPKAPHPVVDRHDQLCPLSTPSPADRFELQQHLRFADDGCPHE